MQRMFPDGPTEWRSPVGCSLLHWVAQTPHVRMLDWLLTFPLDVNAPTPYGTTPLMWACFSHQKAMARRLLDHGAALQATGLNGWTALHWACAHEWVDGVTWLLEQGANPDAQTDRGHRPEEVVSMSSPHYATLCARLKAVRHDCGLK
jgi:ankyrin repeat protein